MKKWILIGLLAVIGCTDDDNTKRTLDAAGYSDITTTGYDAWSCGKGDDYATKFTAKNPVGKRVSGVVCCGAWAKGCTIRF